MAPGTHALIGWWSANSAALNERQEGYFVWGIDDATHQIVGTTFKPRSTKVKGQELESWLGTQLHPRVDFRIHELKVDGHAVVLFIVPAAVEYVFGVRHWMENGARKIAPLR